MKRTNLILLLLIGLTACEPDVSSSAAREPAADARCELDGMTLADHAGPKGQLRYADGGAAYFCNTKELLTVYFAPEQVRKIAAAYTQDMAKAAWEHPEGHWIVLQDAWFVIGSRRAGSMGPTFASFAVQADAESFAQQYGGRVLPFAAIPPDLVRMEGSTHGDHAM